MNTPTYNMRAVMLAVGLCATFFPSSHAYAVSIINTVESHASTGGKISGGGEDGMDGANGRDGNDGTDGSHGRDSTYTGTAEVHIKTYVNGELVKDLHDVRDDEGNISLRADIAPRAQVSAAAEASVESEPPIKDESTVQEFPAARGILGLLSTIRVTLMSYAIHLF